MHLSEWYANDGDAENEAVENMGEPDPDAAHEEPQHIHEYAQTAGLRWLPLHLCAERPDGKHTQFYTLYAKWDADNGYHQNEASNEILQGNVQPTKDNPDDVS